MFNKLVLLVVAIAISVGASSYDVPKGWEKKSLGNYHIGLVPGAGSKGGTCMTISSVVSSPYGNSGSPILKGRTKQKIKGTDITFDRETGFAFLNGRHSYYGIKRSGLPASGQLTQNIDAVKFRGKKISISGNVRCEDVSVYAGLFVRFFDKDGNQFTPISDDQTYYSITFRQLDPNQIDLVDTAMRGTRGWTKNYLVVDVPENAENIEYGGILYGLGKMWFENITVNEVTKDAKVNMLGLELKYKRVLGSEGVFSPHSPRQR